MENPTFESDNATSNNYNATSIETVKEIANKNDDLNDTVIINKDFNDDKQIEANINESHKKWSQYSQKEKILYVIYAILKIFVFIFLLYLFLISLSFMTIGFTMVSGYTIKAGPIVKFFLNSPFSAVALGVIVTALLQNATAVTSIAVSMVGAGIINDMESAIYLVIGANVGTCVTNALISLTLSGDPNEFKRAFAAATLGDMFNLLTASILVPIEMACGLLNRISIGITSAMNLDNPSLTASMNFMGSIINPVLNVFIVLDPDAVDRVSNGGNDTIIALRCCKKANVTNSSHITNEICLQKCSYWCMPMINGIGDGATGLFWIIISILTLILCLFGIVKILSLLIVGPIAKGVRIVVNASFKGRWSIVSDVLLFLFSVVITLIVQSSNIISATLVPLNGIGLITLKRVNILTLGTNLGTTVTGILTAFTLPSSCLKKGMQLAMVYTWFNIFGVIFWIIIPVPRMLARRLGDIVYKYRWFVILYVLGIYFIIPLIMFAFGLIPYWIGIYIFGIPIVVIGLTIGVLHLLIKKKPEWLPEKLRTFEWLPLYLRSLKPLNDKIQNISKKMPCCKCVKTPEEMELARLDDFPHEFNLFTETIRKLSVVESLVSEGHWQTSRRASLKTISSSSNDGEIRRQNDEKIDIVNFREISLIDKSNQISI